MKFEIAESQVNSILALARKSNTNVETVQNEFLEQTHFISNASNLEIDGHSTDYIVIYNNYKDGFVCGQTMVMTNQSGKFDFLKRLYKPTF